MKRPRAVLIGPPGSGKTTVGRALADRLGAAFRDTDADVEATAGKPISEIFIDDGEERFRALEREAVAAALAEHEGVLALGGGAILDAGTQRLLAGHTVVYLQVGLSEAVKRVGLGAARPLLVLNPRSQLRKLMEQRRPIYERLATITVDTDGRETAEVVDELAAALTEEAP
ncbi:MULTISPECIES: shikimate kinase [Thermomonospora]|uniref:Shikimate kinase n=1 Tax=Thermomonospora curvata (strain ATCC 19995 / DSM 43183 / JCM 3096 / KCTC 9072 / NBRC 15933 / NCIMB 10081 / Henssen B9) TaxID=471852 RepID=D1A7X2_THECD|nr:MULTISPECIES: shikimate kinase [Thermomonospora]ACY98494.1 Shikimate kinase [Thermomonospora curvata DSM 43183]PKK13639.1 MAG: shikimate kinase [Thermomonospora sp. CIF 1]